MNRWSPRSNVMKNLTGWSLLERSDKDLVSAAQAGDMAAFDHLILRHQRRVFAVAYHILGNAEDAADVQQEAFVRAWSKLRGFRGDASFTTWLHRIAVNICINKKRRSRPASSVEQDGTLAALADHSNRPDRLLNSVLVRQLLAEIPAKQRTVLVLREVEGMSIGEISQITGASVEAVRKQLWRVRKQFGELLRQNLVEDER